jgi:hypothetical protein
MDRIALGKVLDVQPITSSLADLALQVSLVHSIVSIPKVVSPMVAVAAAS